MNEALERLLVTIEGSSELLRQELKKGGVEVGTFARQTNQQLGGVQQGFNKLGSGLRSALAAFGVGFGVAQIVRFTSGAIQAADAVGEMARAADVGAERFQRLQIVFDQNGVGANEFGSAMSTLNTRLGQFIHTGGGPAKAALDQLGLSQRVLNGEIGDSEALFAAIVKAFEGVTSSAERAAIAAALFGREAGAKMQDTLAKGTQALEAAAAAANNVFTDDQVQKADALSDAIKRLTTSVGVGLKGAFVDFAAQLGTAFGVDELQNMEKSIEARLYELQLRENSLRPGTFTGTNEARHRILGGIAQEREAIRIEQLSAMPFVQLTPAQRAAMRGGWGDGFDEITARPALTAERRRAMGFRDMPRLPVDAGLEEMTVGARRIGSADEFGEQRRRLGMREMPDFRPMIQRTEEYAEAVDKARERQERLADAIAASFESRGMEALISGRPRDAIRGFAQDLAELVFRMAVLQPLAEKLAGTLSSIGAGSGGGGGGGFFANLFSGLKFAGGGRPPVGRASLVGEKGPELWVPDVPGRIYSHAQSVRMAGAGAGGPPIINQNFYNQIGLPPQWDAHLFVAGQAAARAAYDAVTNRLGGKR